MTEQEKKAQQQKNLNVIEAGRGAYRMMIPINGNPHTKQPYRDLWDKGWRLERRKDEGYNPVQAPRPPFKANPSEKKPYKPHPRFNNGGKPGRPQQVPQKAKAPFVPKPAVESPILNDSLIARFNRRHQTQN